jgi:signal transduction histidine kinase/AraC-like DNA-binding protein
VEYDPASGLTRLFTKADGLPASEFNRSTSYRAPDDRIFMGTVSGMIAFYPESIPSSYPSGKMVVTGVSVLNRPVQPQGPGWQLPEFAHTDNSLAFQFALMDFFNPERNQYRYRLNGEQDDWIHLQTNNAVSLANLAPGDYCFEVSGTNGKNDWSEPVQVHFTIRKPWWATWWARSLIALATLLGLALLVWNRFQLERQRHRVELLRQRTEQQAEIEAFKSRILANFTHDLRTPLTIIQGMSGQLASELKGSLREAARAIQRNGAEMLHMVNRMLDLSRLQETGALPLSPKPGNLSRIVVTQADFYQYAAHRAGLAFAIEAPENDLWMEFDEHALQAVLGNLLSNAVKFTPEGGQIILGLSVPAHGKVAIIVQDTGIGIPPEELARIFDRFYQTQQAAARGGTGIGLAHAVELASQMGGRIEVESRVGEGSIFRLVLPYKPCLPQTTAVAPGEAPAADEAPQQLPLSLKDIRILLVEDNRELAAYMAGFLEQTYEVSMAFDGLSGLKKIVEELPDIIVSDVMMPGMDGFELCRLIKTDARTCHIPFILLTARAEKEDLREGLREGANAYLAKPFDKDVLLLQIANLLRLKDAQQAAGKSVFTPGQTPLPGLNPIDQEFLEKLRAEIEAHYADAGFGVAELERLLNMSKSQLHRKVTALTGQTAGQLLRQHRLEEARALLLSHPDRSIAEIAFDTGFGDPNYFSTAFRKEYGMPPAEYRKSKA